MQKQHEAAWSIEGGQKWRELWIKRKKIELDEKCILDTEVAEVICKSRVSSKNQALFCPFLCPEAFL